MLAAAAESDGIGHWVNLRPITSVKDS